MWHFTKLVLIVIFSFGWTLSIQQGNTSDVGEYVNRMYSESEIERVITEEMSDNLKGSCRWRFGGGNGLDTASADVQVFYRVDPVDAQEWLDYSSSKSALTAANKFLLTGLYNGEDQMTKWRNSKRMHFAVPRTHARNSQRELCIHLAEGAVKRPQGVRPYQSLQRLSKAYYWMQASNALVSSLGVLALQCGYWQGHDSCLTNIRSSGRNWRRSCNKLVPEDQWSSLANRRNFLIVKTKHKKVNLSDPENRSIYQCLFESRELHVNASLRLTDPIRTKKLFLMTAAWDRNWHHLLFEGLLRLFQHAVFLKKNPDVLVHMEAEDVIISDPHSKCGKCRVMRENVLQFFNISKDRIRRGVVFAEQVLWSRPIHCSSPLHHAVELRKLAKTMISIAWGIQADTEKMTLLEVHSLVPKVQKPIVLVQDRRCHEKSEIKCDERAWNETFFSGFVKQVQLSLSASHDVVVDEGGGSIEKIVKLHSRGVDILFALHGAGITNVMFLKPQGLLVEIVGFWDGRVLPLCGHFGPFASVFGVNHFIYSFDSYSKWMLFSPDDVIEKAIAFYKKLS